MIRHSYVGFVRIKGYLPTRTYNYTLCLNSLPEDVAFTTDVDERQPWINAIDNGIAIWPSTTGMVTATKANEVTTDTDCARIYADTTTNMVERVIPRVMTFGRCGATAVGCAKTYVEMDSSADDFGEMGASKISIRTEQVNTTPQGSSCSQFYRVVQHEAGHAFGLDDPPTDSGNESAMDNRHRTCTPTKYDIAAIKAIYQSRG